MIIEERQAQKHCLQILFSVSLCNGNKSQTPHSQSAIGTPKAYTVYSHREYFHQRQMPITLSLLVATIVNAVIASTIITTNVITTVTTVITIIIATITANIANSNTYAIAANAQNIITTFTINIIAIITNNIITAITTIVIISATTIPSVTSYYHIAYCYSPCQ